MRSEYEFNHEKMLKEAERIIQKSLDNEVNVWIENEDGTRFLIKEGFLLKGLKFEALDGKTANEIIDILLG